MLDPSLILNRHRQVPERTKTMDEFLKWVADTNKTLAPHHYRIIFLPDDDLMPYDHMTLNTNMSDALIKLTDNYDHELPETINLTVTADELDMLQMALLIYKTVLMEVHKDEVKAGIRRVIEAMGKKQKEEADGRREES